MSTLRLCGKITRHLGFDDDLLMKKVLITGGTGYLGGRLLQEIKTNHINWQVFVGTRNQTNRNISDYSTPINTNWTSQASLDDACKDIDIVIHLAAMDAASSKDDPVGALLMNGVATARLVNAAIRNGVSRFIYLSTSHVYGASLVGDITENTPPNPIHPYSTSHRAGEDVVNAAGISGSIETVVIRLSNSFGAPVDPKVNCWSLLVPDLCRQCITNQQLKLNSSGRQRRDFITITDACRAIIHLSEVPINKLKSLIYNVGGNYSPTIIEMAQRIKSRFECLFKKDIEILTLNNSDDEVASDFNYCTRLLFKSGFKFIANVDAEIDDLLLFCFNNYNDK